MLFRCYLNAICCFFFLAFQIFNTSAFAYDANAEDAFLNAPIVTVTEAIGSPRNRRVSILGHITEVMYIL